MKSSTLTVWRKRSCWTIWCDSWSEAEEPWPKESVNFPWNLPWFKFGVSAVLEAESYRPAIDLLTWPLPEQLHWTDLGPKATLFPVTCQCQVEKNIRYALCKVLISWLVSAGHSQVPQKKIPQTAVCMFPKLGTTKNPDSSLTELDHRMGMWHLPIRGHLPVYSARTHTLNCR